MMKFRSVIVGIGLTALSQVLLAQQPTPARNNAEPVAFKIAAQPMPDALTAFAQQTGLQLIVSTEAAQKLTAPEVSGTLTPEAGLKQLLAKSGLHYQFINERTVAIRAANEYATKALTKTSAVQAEAHERPLVLAQAQTDQPGQPGQAEESTTAAENKAAPALEEIIVTAEKRSERIQDLPIAISAYSGETLDIRGVDDIASLPQLAPSTQVWVHPGVGARVSIRGISTELGSASDEAAITMSQDGVAYATAHLLNADFFDIERIEVLRGPQGTISGRNATAGAIHIHSNRPTEDFQGGVKATLGNYERMAVEGFLSGPISGERLLGRLAVRTDRADGWVNNTLLGEELGSIDKVQARASFLAQVTDDFEAHLILDGVLDRSIITPAFYVDHGRLRPDTPTLTEALGVPAFDRDSNTVQFNAPHANHDKERYQATLRLAWQLGPAARLTAITGYVHQETSFPHDSDSTTESVEHFHELASTTRQVSQEVTLTADLTNRLDVVAGALYLDSDLPVFLDLTAFDVFAIQLQADAKLTSWAGYTQWRYRLTDALRVTAGVRYTHDKKDFAQDLSVNGAASPRAASDGSWNAWTPRLSVDYSPSDDLTLYASASRGFKSGTVPVNAPLVDPEFVWNYEVGVKASKLGGRLQTALTGFYMDYTDLQQLLFIFDNELLQTRSVLINAESASISGVELELDTQLTDRFRVGFAGTWLDATYDELRTHDNLFPEIGVPQADGVTLRDLSGNRLVRSAEWQFNVSGEYRVPLGFLGADRQGVLRASYAWQDDVFYEIFNRGESASAQGAYGLVNLFGAIETNDGRWQLSAFVHNLTDKEYYPNKLAAIGLSSVPYARAWSGAPRRYGINLAYRF